MLIFRKKLKLASLRTEMFRKAARNGSYFIEIHTQDDKNIIEHEKILIKD